MTRTPERMAIDEAIEHLGLLRSERASDLARFMQLLGPISAREMSASYFKDGEQISEMEKRFLGVGTNAYMSRSALEDLTSTGLLRPRDAHPLTFARALTSVQRFREIQKCLKGNSSKVACAVEAGTTCAVCIKWDGLALDVSQVSPFGPSDCPKQICNLRLLSFEVPEKGVMPWRWGNFLRSLYQSKKTRDDRGISR